MKESGYAHEPTIGLLEFSSVARGVLVTDQVVKRAEVRVLFARFVSPGRYVTMFTGSVESVRSSLAIGVEVAQDALVDQLFIPAVHDGLLGALTVPVEVPELDAVAVVETSTIAAAIEAADAALKRSNIALIELRLARGLGGKSYFSMTGALAEIETSLAAASEVARKQGRLVETALIPRPHPDMTDVLGGHGRPI